MSHDLSRRLVEAACKREGVKEKLPGAWLGQRYSCPACGALFKILVAGTNCPSCCIRGTHENAFPVFYKYTGPDLTRHDQLHSLLALADAVLEPAEIDYRVYLRDCMTSTRTDAVIAALCAALGVER